MKFSNILRESGWHLRHPFSFSLSADGDSSILKIRSVTNSEKLHIIHVLDFKNIVPEIKFAGCLLDSLGNF